MLLAGFDQLWRPAEAAHVALVARRHALAPLAPPPQQQPPPEGEAEAETPPFSLYNEEAFIQVRGFTLTLTLFPTLALILTLTFIQGEDPCFSLVQPEGGVSVSQGGAADAAPCAYGSADGAGAGLFILKVSSE